MSIKSEIDWRPVPQYEGKYRVNNLGQIQNVKTGKMLKQFVTHGGYLRVFLYGKGHKRKSFFAHRVVCRAFYDNPQNYPQVNHINMNKQDNRPENLEWCSQSYNLRHSFANGGREKNKVALLMANHKEVISTSPSGEKKRYFSLSEASRQTGIDISNISACCHGRIKRVGGLTWELA